MNRIFVELDTRPDGCVAVIVRRDSHVVQTPYLVTAGPDAARAVVAGLRLAYPNDCCTLIGFTP